MSQQKAIDKRITDIRRAPSQGDNLQGQILKGLLHTHVRGRSSNLLVIWSHEENPKKITIEAVGPHKIIAWLERQKKI